MRCANPLCKTESNYFRAGSLHCIDCSEQSEGERRVIWLCPDCSARMTVQTWRPAGQQMQPRHLKQIPLTEAETELAASA
jgi:ribosomal protein L37AE/L43A